MSSSTKSNASEWADRAKLARLSQEQGLSEEPLASIFKSQAFSIEEQESLYRFYKTWETGTLADWQIRELVETVGMIDPFVDHKVREEGHALSHGLGEDGYDVRLGNVFRRYKDSDQPLDPANLNDNDLETIETEMLVLPPHGFILGVTQETIKLPPFLRCTVDNKSTLARLGIDSSFTTSLRPDSSNRVTLEIKNHNNRPVILRAGDGIAAFRFEKMSGLVENGYNGRYNGQALAAGPTGTS
jgi:deoxycytidine triphosphate deaminase